MSSFEWFKPLLRWKSRRDSSQTVDTGTFLQAPPGIRNIAHWEENCRKIHARAKDLIEGKIGVIEAARSLHLLSIWTSAQKDEDFLVFHEIDFGIIGLPVGSERQYWAKHALEQQDVTIHALEEYWISAALISAHRLVKKYRWALAARQRRRMLGTPRKSKRSNIGDSS